MEDEINKLPVDESRVSDKEEEIISSLNPDSVSQNSARQNIQPNIEQKTVNSKPKTQFTSSVYHEIKTLIIVTVLFVLVSSETFESIIVKMFPSLDKWYYILAIRTVLFVLLYYIITNIGFLKK